MAKRRQTYLRVCDLLHPSIKTTRTKQDLLDLPVRDWGFLNRKLRQSVERDPRRFMKILGPKATFTSWIMVQI